MQNNMHELWAILHMLYPDVFKDPTPFDESFNISGPKHVVDSAALAAAHDMLAPLCLRREKKDVELSVPPKTETTVLCPLSTKQTAMYRDAILQNYEAIDGEKSDYKMLKSLCMHLRMITGHPMLVRISRPQKGCDGARCRCEHPL